MNYTLYGILERYRHTHNMPPQKLISRPDQHLPTMFAFLVAPHGRIAACMVTLGIAHDSPIFQEMFARMPDGDGHVMLDSAYDACANCRMIYDSGRKPVIWPRRNHIAKGFNPRAEMLRWFRRDQEGFEKVYHQRSLVESVFSSMKEKFVSVVAAKTLPMQRL